jgi:hypothetical protein
MRDAVSAVNGQIRTLAPALNAASLEAPALVTSSNPEMPVEFLVKRHREWIYVFAVAARGGSTGTEATFRLAWPVGGSAEVMGEGRRVPVLAGSFVDAFAAYDVHLYRVPADGWLGLPWIGR